ncbi:MAG: hypothetical protein K8S97_14435 [Anaerolineae bacterium]|nr:hypothetical protein [Anaerolineae bacterium]
MPKKTQTLPPTVITLTLPDSVGEGALLIQHGDLAHMSQFAYTPDMDFTSVIQQAVAALAVVESDPPVIPDEPARKTTTESAPPPEPPEPMLQIPTKKKKKKGTTAIPARCLQITGSETDVAVQEQALKVAGRLLDSELWDGKTPIGVNDASAVLRRLDGLTDKELNVLFKLEQFVQVNPDAAEDKTDAPQDDSAEDNGVQDPPASEDKQDAAEVLEVANTTKQPGLI